MSTNVGVDTATAAARRRQRRLRSWLRHERMTVIATLAEKLHHTSRGPKIARVREEVVHDAHDALRGPKTPPLGVRPGSLAAEERAQSAALLRGNSSDSSAEASDGRTLRSLLRKALALQEEEDEERRKVQEQEKLKDDDGGGGGPRRLAGGLQQRW